MRYILYIVITLMFRHTVVAEIITFNACSWNTLPIVTYGAKVIFRQENYGALNCSAFFKTPIPSMTFVLYFENVDIRVNETCLDSLSIMSTNDDDPILNNFCGKKENLEILVWHYTKVNELQITWKTAPSQLDSYSNFDLVLTAIANPMASCDSPEFTKCDLGDCIRSELLCDGVSNCYSGEDEETKMCPGILDETHVQKLNSLVTTTATESPIQTTTLIVLTMFDENVYLWLPLVVVLIFTGVMVSLIMIGRRSDTRSRGLVGSPESSDSRVQINTNPGYAEDGRHSPPPTYSFIERQTSVVSHISQTSSQIEFPPDYDDALDLPKINGAEDNNNSSSSRRGSRSRRNMFGRSMSSGSSNRRNRNRPQRHLSDSGVPTIRFRIESETSSVFSDLGGSHNPRGSMISEESSENVDGAPASANCNVQATVSLPVVAQVVDVHQGQSPGRDDSREFLLHVSTDSSDIQSMSNQTDSNNGDDVINNANGTTFL